MASEENIEAEATPGYKPPAEKSLGDIVGQDTDDQSLEDYKKKLLGESATVPQDPRQVVVSKLELLADGREPVSLDLTGNLEKVKKSPFSLKEGCKYRIRIHFYVQRDIVSGLKYVHAVYRKGIRVDKEQYMMGSYGPKMESQSFTTPAEDAPSGMLQRGTYTIKSVFTDDDKKEYLKWEWALEIKKDWSD